jgi:hypothetical protein
VDADEKVARPGGMLVVVTLVLVTASWVSFLAPISIHNFGGNLLALGANLPPATRFVVMTPQVWRIFVMLGVALFVWVIARSRVTRGELGRMKLAMRLLIVAMLLAYGLAAWAIYTPLLELGKTI